MSSRNVRRSVIKVNGERRNYLLTQQEDVLIQGDDDEFHWREPSSFELRSLHDFLNGKYPTVPRRFWQIRVGTRIGWDKEGVYMHEMHARRYFGIDRLKANAILVEEHPEAAPKYSSQQASGGTTQGFLSKMLNDLPALSDEVRYKVLYASFVRADRNKNGLLSRPELSTVLRKVMLTLRNDDMELIMMQADEDDDGQINYKEFSDWMQRSNHDGMQKHLQASLQNDSDIVKATFRMWDQNGDGLIADGKLCKSLVRIFPNSSEKQLMALTQAMDANHSGDIDYEEFVDFLFNRHNRG